MANTESWTIGRLLSWTADYLGQHGSDSPRLDAEILLAHALDVERIDLYMRINEEPSEEQRAVFRELVSRRAKHAPVAYLVGAKEFFSLSFRVSPDVLIPRPETELLVVGVMDLERERAEACEPREAPVRICDVGTGSGAIAVSLAKYLPNSEVTAIDLSDRALAVARENAAKHGVQDRVTLLHGDLLSVVPLETQFDYIVSNPPYVTDAEMQELSPEVADYEPHSALRAGPKGTEVIQRLLPQAVEHLVPGGWLMIELSPMIHDAAYDLLAATPGLEPAETLRDLARHPRVIRGRRI